MTRNSCKFLEYLINAKFRLPSSCFHVPQIGIAFKAVNRWWFHNEAAPFRKEKRGPQTQELKEKESERKEKRERNLSATEEAILISLRLTLHWSLGTMRKPGQGQPPEGQIVSSELCSGPLTLLESPLPSLTWPHMLSPKPPRVHHHTHRPMTPSECHQN